MLQPYHQEPPSWKPLSTKQKRAVHVLHNKCPLQQNHHDLWILLICIPKCDLLAQDSECPDGGQWDEPRRPPGIQCCLHKLKDRDARSAAGGHFHKAVQVDCLGASETQALCLWTPESKGA